MRLSTIALVILLLFPVQSANAGMVEDIKEKVRPYIVQYLGKEAADKILGKGESSIKLPKIPEIKANAKSVSEMGLGPKNNVTFKEDQERRYNYFYIKELFQATRRLEATDEDLAKWMNVMNQSGSREGVYRALVLDGTYLSLENYDFPMEAATINFTIDYIARFLNKSISEEALEKANFFTVKRDISEKTLEILDELFKLKGDEVYDWYAVFSAELAERYPKAMNNKTRREKDPEKHKLWAKNVPDQYIKSEVLIKLHQVFNIVQG